MGRFDRRRAYCERRIGIARGKDASRCVGAIERGTQLSDVHGTDRRRPRTERQVSEAE